MKTLNILIIMSLFIGLKTYAQKNVEKETKTFHIIDDNNDNVLTLSEMMIYYSGKTNKDGSPKEANKLFYGLDGNKDRKITLEEFIKKVDWKLIDKQIAERNKRLGIIEEKPKAEEKPKTIDDKPKRVAAKPKMSMDAKKEARFKHIDKDNNNEISMSEILEFHKGQMNKAGKPVEADVIFYGSDINNDNKLTLQEYIQKPDWRAGKQKKARIINEYKKPKTSEKTGTNKISDKQIIFKEIDIIGDNKLSKDELIAYNKGRTDEIGNPINGAIVFYGLDENKDGYVSQSEFGGEINWKLGKRRFKANKK